MDFYRIVTVEAEKKGEVSILPDFRPAGFKDLMVRGGGFYAIWDSKNRVWSTDEYDAALLVDTHLAEYERDLVKEEGKKYSLKRMDSFNSRSWMNFKSFMKSVADRYHPLDDKLVFADQETVREDYSSKKLPYSLSAADCPAWDELVGTLYSPEEREKIEWAIGAVFSGDSKKIQKFLVFYGSAGTGKSTILNIIEKLFEGYTATFEAKALGSANGTFATEAFKTNPLVAIQHDGDLSRIEDNTKLNSIISHEEILVNEKYKSGYSMRVSSMLFMGTNQPVRITDSKSGILRRLIDVHPTGMRISPDRYNVLMEQIQFELGAIANRCLDIYKRNGKNYYNAYRPIEMMAQTDYFYNFVMMSSDIFVDQGGVTLKQAWDLFKEFCAEEKIESKMPKFKFREELKSYFVKYEHRGQKDGEWVWNWYSGFDRAKFEQGSPIKEQLQSDILVLNETDSILDQMLAIQPAQYGKEDGTPAKYWTEDPRTINGELKIPDPSQVVDTTLADIDTTQLHFVKVPANHIVIDFDLKDDNGNKSLERNLAAASSWPATYAELSQGGGGVHLHYLFDGDVDSLSGNFDDGIEIKVYRGNASLRRRLTKCNNNLVTTISGGLPLKEKKPVLDQQMMKNERSVRNLIERNLRKEINPGTKVSIDFIHKILEDAYKSGMPYDVTDMRSEIVRFALGSSNQSEKALEIVTRMKFKSENDMEPAREVQDDRLVIFDCEVYPNLFVVCWKYQGSSEVVRMVNPTPQEIEALFKYKLIGFNNRQYDNHILYARHLGYTNEALYDLSQRIIANTPGAKFGEAYNLSYGDIYDFSSKKLSLKKFQIELGLVHKEMDIPWDKPVPEDRVADVVEYCANDVDTTDDVLKDRKADLTAREILAELSGLTVNHTTQQHTARIIFGTEKNPQQSFIYTELNKEFPGYEYSFGKSTYRDELVGEGGLVRAKPGMYNNVALLDVASMHPTSIIQLNLFGDEYTPRFKALLDARLAIKKGDYASACEMLDGRLTPFLTTPHEGYDIQGAKDLSYALKIVINIVYGLTSAKFENKFHDVRNKDNIVAKRGALFMIDLMHFVEERGFTVAHIKTDSIKIPDATPEIIEEVTRFGKKYGYDFEHEATYDKFCLVNDAVYIAKKMVNKLTPGEGNAVLMEPKWEAVGAQFQEPVVYKTLFSKEELSFRDHCVTKQVAKGSIYLDFDQISKDEDISTENFKFIGRTGRFMPVRAECGGAVMYRVHEDKLYAVTGTKGYLWKEEATVVDWEFELDKTYFQKLVDDAVSTIEKFGNFEEFVK